MRYYQLPVSLVYQNQGRHVTHHTSLLGVTYHACTIVLLCINQHTKFQVRSFTDSKDMIVSKFKQVAHLSLTNPHDALHHRLTTKFLKQSRDHKHALSSVICHPVARIDIAYLCTKFDDFRFSRSSDMTGAPKIFMGHMTWPRLYQRRFVVRRLRLAHLTSTSNLQSLRSPITKMHKATQNAEIEVG